MERTETIHRLALDLRPYGTAMAALEGTVQQLNRQLEALQRELEEVFFPVQPVKTKVRADEPNGVDAAPAAGASRKRSALTEPVAAEEGFPAFGENTQRGGNTKQTESGGKKAASGVEYKALAPETPSEAGEAVRSVSGAQTAMPAFPALALGQVLPQNPRFSLAQTQHSTADDLPLVLDGLLDDQTQAMLAGFETTAALQRQLLEAVRALELGDEPIGRAAARYTEKMTRINGERL